MIARNGTEAAILPEEETLVKRFSRSAGARGARRAKPRRAKPRRVKISPELRAYIRKTDRYRAGRDPIKLQRSAPAKFARAIAGLSAKQMRRRPAPGKWSIIEILGHLHDTEVVYGYRNRLTLSQPGCTILGYDQAEFVKQLRHRKANAKKLIAQIRVLREGNLDTVLRVPRRQWKRFGMHNERGRQTVRRNLELIAGHDLNHLDQILAIRKKFGW
jgi:uncharacterized damage-inducible protein DinB